jgi:hypothetical protein
MAHTMIFFQFGILGLCYAVRENEDVAKSVGRLTNPETVKQLQSVGQKVKDALADPMTIFSASKKAVAAAPTAPAPAPAAAAAAAVPSSSSSSSVAITAPVASKKAEEPVVPDSHIKDVVAKAKAEIVPAESATTITTSTAAVATPTPAPPAPSTSSVLGTETYDFLRQSTDLKAQIDLQSKGGDLEAEKEQVREKLNKLTSDLFERISWDEARLLKAMQEVRFLLMRGF